MEGYYNRLSVANDRFEDRDQYFKANNMPTLDLPASSKSIESRPVVAEEIDFPLLFKNRNRTKGKREEGLSKESKESKEIPRLTPPPVPKAEVKHRAVQTEASFFQETKDKELESQATNINKFLLSTEIDRLSYKLTDQEDHELLMLKNSKEPELLGRMRDLRKIIAGQKIEIDRLRYQVECEKRGKSNECVEWKIQGQTSEEDKKKKKGHELAFNWKDKDSRRRSSRGSI